MTELLSIARFRCRCRCRRESMSRFADLSADRGCCYPRVRGCCYLPVNPARRRSVVVRFIIAVVVGLAIAIGGGRPGGDVGASHGDTTPTTSPRSHTEA